ncbi:MAG: hypothetical protein KDC01_12315 [Flavobacteriales bacterium]|jgi:hypothetical protein|nr:hypothetical protein [Flavobacteriales bacterium]
MSVARVFVPKEGGFEKLDCEALQFEEMTKQLGYHPSQIRSFMNMDNLSYDWVYVGFKIFTTEIICVVTRFEPLSVAQVKDYTAPYNPKYNGQDMEDVLDAGVEGGALTSTYLAEVLHMEDFDPNGSVVCPSIGYELVFMDGVLIGYKAIDGLNKWAKLIKETNPKLFSNYVVSYRNKGFSEEVVREQINAQCNAFASIPQGLQNPLIERYCAPDGTIDFVQLKVTHYN